MAGSATITANHSKAIAKTGRSVATLVRDMERITAPGMALSMENYESALLKALKATRPMKLKDGTVLQVPDDRTRESAMGRWERLLERTTHYTEGLPVQRSESIERHIDETEAGLRARLIESPAMRRRLREILDEVESLPVEAERIESGDPSEPEVS